MSGALPQPSSRRNAPAGHVANAPQEGGSHPHREVAGESQLLLHRHPTY